MIINSKGKFAVLGDFKLTHCNDPGRKANRCNSMVLVEKHLKCQRS